MVMGKWGAGGIYGLWGGGGLSCILLRGGGSACFFLEQSQEVLEGGGELGAIGMWR